MKHINKPNLTRSQVVSFLLFLSFFWINPVYAIDNPLATPNNKFGVHLIQPSVDQLESVTSLVNSSGDWGYVTILIESKDRNHDKWQNFFNELRRRHLIPIVRLATEPEGGFWKKPYEGEETAWAGFLDDLIWPTKNHYVTIYNEPNQGQEWANTVDPADYAKTLDKTINALKKKNEDFFVLNAGLDASAPNKLPAYMDSGAFMQAMDQAVPGIFTKLDGWVSHSYPNPGFVGSPRATGKGTVRTFEWEEQILNQLGVNKKLPVFITETGWKHAEGTSFDKSLPSSDIVAQYYKDAFENAWKNDQIVAVTPFILNYQTTPFDHFSFQKIGGDKTNNYPQFNILASFPKEKGQPLQHSKAQLVKGSLIKQNLDRTIEGTASGKLTSSLIAGEDYQLSLTLKNIGESIWNDSSQMSLVALSGGDILGIKTISLPQDKKIEPNESYTFSISFKAPSQGKYDLSLNLQTDKTKFETSPIQINFETKSPIYLKVQAGLKWKDNFSGDYVLTVLGDVKSTINRAVENLVLGESGGSSEFKASYLLPDREYNFTIEKPFYKPKTIHQVVHSGPNTLDFGELQPDIPSAVLHPSELWTLFPWSK